MVSDTKPMSSLYFSKVLILKFLVCRWEEKGKEEGVKWKFLEHKGPMFAPPYEPLPDDVHFIYNGKKMRLCAEAEEVAGFFARMIEHEYTTKKIFRDNFMKDWKKVSSEFITETPLICSSGKYFL